MQLTFHGGATTVTGSMYLIESGGTKVLVDCGMLQGKNFTEADNFKDFPFGPKEIDAVFVTHAHIDHTGRLPKLISDGFTGPVYSTPPTKAVAEYTLQDSIEILAKEAERCKEAGFCTPGNIERLMSQWKTVEYHDSVEHGPFTVTFNNAGHILGSSFLILEAEGKSVAFSGDLGNIPTPLIKQRENLERADYCLIESTYGGRIHDDSQKAKEELEDVVEESVALGGTLIIPSFSMERTQVLLYHLNELMERHQIPQIPVFLDSPLAIQLTEVYGRYTSYLNTESAQFLEGEGRLFSFPMLQKTETVQESRSIFKVPAPKIVIAGAGMSQGGRIMYHEQAYLPDGDNTILFVGYQVEGSLGRKILDGERKLEIFGKPVTVRARVREITGYSAHADQPQLVDWIRDARFGLKKVFVVQGEPSQAKALSQRIRDELAIDTTLPEAGETVVL